MRAVVQRISSAAVDVDGVCICSAGKGLLVFVGVGKDSGREDVKYIADKIVNLRIFPDEQGKMNCSLLDVGAELLIVSQFTLYGDCRKGRRPGFDLAAAPEYARELYEAFVEYCRALGIKVETGRFQADMKVSLINDGPVTIMLDSKKLF